jgi:hypothetical protein
MSNKTDWFLESLEGQSNKDKTSAYNSGFDFELKNAEDYWSNTKIREKYADKRDAYERDYNSAVDSYNQYQQYENTKNN